MSERLDTFDNISQKITQVRGKDYQHPSIDFAKAMELKACVQNCKDPLVRHTLEMICLKVARLVHNPSHLDSWIDIAGYARCGVMVTEPQDFTEVKCTCGVGIGPGVVHDHKCDITKAVLARNTLHR